MGGHGKMLQWKNLECCQEQIQFDYRKVEKICLKLKRRNLIGLSVSSALFYLEIYKNSWAGFCLGIKKFSLAKIGKQTNKKIKKN